MRRRQRRQSRAEQVTQGVNIEGKQLQEERTQKEKEKVSAVLSEHYTVLGEGDPVLSRGLKSFDCQRTGGSQVSDFPCLCFHICEIGRVTDSTVQSPA